MELTLRVYTKKVNYMDSRVISLNDGELDEIISNYLIKEEYIKDDEKLIDITFESITL